MLAELKGIRGGLDDSAANGAGDLYVGPDALRIDLNPPEPTAAT